MSFKLREVVTEALKNERDPRKVTEVFQETYQAVTYPSTYLFRSLFICAAINREREDVADLALHEASEKYDLNFKLGHASPLPLVAATENSSYGLMKKLMLKGARPTLVGTHGDAPGAVASSVQVAVLADDVTALKILRNLGDTPQIRERHDLVTIVDLLNLAARHSAYECARECIRTNQEAVNGYRLGSRHPESVPPLIMAVQNRDRSMVDLLLSSGASVNYTTCVRRYTAMHYAADVPHKVLNQMEDIIKDLVEHHADVNAVSASGDTPISLAVGRMLHSPNCDLKYLETDNSTSQLETLMSHGCLVNPSEGKGALEACFSDFTPCLYRLDQCDPVQFLQWFDDLLKFLFSHGVSLTSYPSMDITSTSRGLSDVGPSLLRNASCRQRVKELINNIFLCFILCSQDRSYNTALCGFLAHESSVLGRRCSLMYLETIPHATHAFTLQGCISQHKGSHITLPTGICRSLKISCRAAILKCLPGARLFTGVSKLALPTSVVEFLKYGSCVDLHVCDDN